MTAHQESNESKDAQEDDWHVSRLFVFVLFQVNLLQADGIMAKHSQDLATAAAKMEHYLGTLLGTPKAAQQETVGAEDRKLLM